jgi:hypothetical protein
VKVLDPKSCNTFAERFQYQNAADDNYATSR